MTTRTESVGRRELVSVCVPRELKRALVERARQDDRSLSSVVRRALDRELADQEREGS